MLHQYSKTDGDVRMYHTTECLSNNEVHLLLLPSASSRFMPGHKISWKANTNKYAGLCMLAFLNSNNKCTSCEDGVNN